MEKTTIEYKGYTIKVYPTFSGDGAVAHIENGRGTWIWCSSQPIMVKGVPALITRCKRAIDKLDSID